MSEKIKDKQLYIAKLEQQIANKYGENTIIPPQWDEDKEKEYIEQIKLISSSSFEQKEEIVEKQGYSVENRLFIAMDKSCSECKTYTKYIIDDLYMTKYKCCYKCYLMNEDKIKRSR